MSETTTIDLSRLPPPAIVETLDFELIFAAMRDDLLLRDPSFSALVESDPAYKILEVAAYRELLLRQRVNESAQACMLATARGADLDNLAAWWGVVRLVVTPADDSSVPPTAAVLESDAALRFRTQLSLNQFTTAGATNAYIFHGLSASGAIKDISVESPTYHIDNGLIVIDDAVSLGNPKPNNVAVTVLSRTGSGVPDNALVSTVEAALNADNIRPLTDILVTRPASIVPYKITAILHLYPGIAADHVTALALEALTVYKDQRHKLGGRVAISGIHEALHRPGVRFVELITPTVDVVTRLHQAPFCTSVELSDSYSLVVKTALHNGSYFHDGTLKRGVGLNFRDGSRLHDGAIDRRFS
ncbi:MAG: baseplate J/gp47 family protein [Methyloprofundus sp.]|nr:baseplate J/gp47 family protein [Methyloprofundus sp.]